MSKWNKLYCKYHPAVVKAKWVTGFLPHFQCFDEVQAELGSLVKPESLWFFHPIAFLGHLGRLSLPPLFPLPFRSDKTYHTGPRVYGYLRPNRKTGKRDRLHAGCDLYAPVGTPIFAVLDGEVKEKSTFFYNATNRLVINHGKFTVLYGEIDPNSVPEHLNVVGAKVKRGEIIATVGALIDKGSRMTNSAGELLEMLHFELYTNEVEGDVIDLCNTPKFRRDDNIDPTLFLDSLLIA